MITAPIKRRRGQRGPGKPRPVKMGVMTDQTILDQLKDGRPYTLPDGTEIRLEPSPPMLRAIMSRMRWLHRFGGAVGRAMAEKMGDRLDRLILRMLKDGQQRILPDGSVVRIDPSGAAISVVVARLAAVEKGIGVEPRRPESQFEATVRAAREAAAEGNESAAAFLRGGPMKFRGESGPGRDSEEASERFREVEQ